MKNENNSMFTDIKILQNMSALAAHAEQRHALIAENIANADTPGFKAKDLQPFSEIYKKAAENGQKIGALQAQVKLMEAGDIASPNGNTVSLEQQTMLAAQTKGEHEMALAVYRKTLEMMKMAIGKNI